MSNWSVLIPTFASLIVGIIGFLTKRSIDAMDQKIASIKSDMLQSITTLDECVKKVDADTDQNIKELRDELYSFKDKVGEDYVKKSDFILTTSALEKKVDKVYDILLDINRRLPK